MSITARDLYFVLRVRDEASNVLNSVSRDILKIGAAAQASSARAQAATLRQQAANVRASGSARAEAMKNAEAATREQAARMRASGATRQQVASLDAQARAYAREAATINAATDKEVASLRRQAQGFDSQAKSLERDVANHQRLSQTFSEVSSAATMMGLALVGAGALGTAALMSTVKAGIEYDRQVALTKTQTDGFKASLQDLGQMAKDVASHVAAPFGEMQAALYDIFSSTNANMAQAKVLLTAFAKAAVAGQVSIEDSSRSTMSIMNAFKIPFQDVNKVLDKQFQLVRKGVGTYAQFSSVIGKLTPSAVRLGQNLDTMDATLIFLTRNGLSTASAVASAARAMDALANPKTVGKLEKLGIKVRDAKGQFLPLLTILKGMSGYLMKLPSAKRAGALFDMLKSSGGTIQAKRFFDLVLPTAKGKGNLKEFETFLNDMKNSSGEFGKAYTGMSNTVAAKTQLLKNNFDVMKTTIGQALEPAFMHLLDIGNKIVGWFNKLTPAQQKNLAKWALMAAAITTVVGVVVLIIGGIGALAAAMAALGLSLGVIVGILALVVGGIVLLGAAMYDAYKKSSPIRQLFIDIGKTFTDLWNKDIWPFIAGVRDGFEKNLIPAFHDVWTVINDRVIPILDELWNNFGRKIVKAVGDAAKIIKGELVSAFALARSMIEKYVIPAIKQLTDLYHKHEGVVKLVISIITQLVKWILILAGSSVVLTLIAVIVTLVATFGVAVKIFTVTVSIISTLVGWIKNAYNWLNNIGKSVNNAADSFGRAMKGGFTATVNWFRNLPGMISHALGNLGNVLWNAGVQIIQGLINGVNNKAAALYNIIKGIGNNISNFFKAALGISSPSRIMAANGKHVINGLIKGMRDATPNLNRQIKNVTDKIQSSVNANITSSPVVPSKAKGSGDKTVVVNVYTQEIRPEYHSQQLGQLIAGTI